MPSTSTVASKPIGKDKGIIYKGGFRCEADYQYLVDLFGKRISFI